MPKTSYRHLMRPKPYLLILSAMYSVFLVISNIASNKIASVAGFNIDGGFIFFPLTYVINDILTEVYGYKTTRQVIWTALFANIITVCGVYLVLSLPPSDEWHHQIAFEQVFDLSGRIFLASLASYVFGEFINSFTLAKMKIITNGNFMAGRFIISTVLGAAVENTLFYFLAFAYVFETHIILEMMTVQYLLKILYEVLLLPLSCALAIQLKKKENLDYFDKKTDFSPISF